jgi:ferritin-like metal-binding protein YciE
MEGVMASTARDLLIVGLRNAHAMERQAHELLERQIERTDDYPEVKTHLRRHRDETRRQIERLEDCLHMVGESRSTFKDVALSALGSLLAMANATAGDEILKNTFANSAFEHYEIAAYKSLLTLCDRAGVDLAETLQQSLNEEVEMAAWIDSHVAQITREYLEIEERAAA